MKNESKIILKTEQIILLWNYFFMVGRFALMFSPAKSIASLILLSQVFLSWKSI